MNNTIAVFDFDGTLTRKDSFKDFLIYQFGIVSFCRGIAANIISVTLYAFKIISNSKAKEKLFQYFFSGWKEEDFNYICTEYSLGEIDKMIDPEAVKKVKWHLSEHHTLVIASASLSNWIAPWAKKSNFHDVIATEPEIKGGVLTGGFATKNCHGPEKLRRFIEKYPNRAQYILYVYGDSSGDKPLLNIADKPFFRRFH